ncbi:MAG: alpha amylase C-terminal domain-containing protein, partial [Paludibacter sp.]|nr:alpha amylase C-terminal domain-containing protein [Paludibacter sp.]
LTAEQKDLRKFYAKLLNITIKEKAITNGIMYDLEYANLSHPFFNSHEQIAYFRKYRDDLLLFVLNFHDKTLETHINLPRESFQFLKLKENQNYEYHNLLDDTEEIRTTQLSSNQTFNTEMPPWTGKIFKFKKQ